MPIKNEFSDKKTWFSFFNGTTSNSTKLSAGGGEGSRDILVFSLTRVNKITDRSGHPLRSAVLIAR